MYRTMFTGIIQHVGEVVRLAAMSEVARVSIDLGPLAHGLIAGASVAVNGACLTVTSIRDGVADFDISIETLSRTTLGRLRPPDKVNLELPVAAGAPLAGHIVTGHIDGICRVIRLDPAGNGVVMRLSAARGLVENMVEKGSIALDGVSLTLVDVSSTSFSVALIPFTLEHTTLGQKRIAEELNVELDIIGKYVKRYLEAVKGKVNQGISLEMLRQYGFV